MQYICVVYVNVYAQSIIYTCQALPRGHAMISEAMLSKGAP